MRVPYSQIFQVNTDGSASPKVPVSINGVQMRPGWHSVEVLLLEELT